VSPQLKTYRLTGFHIKESQQKTSETVMENSLTIIQAVSICDCHFSGMCKQAHCHRHMGECLHRSGKISWPLNIYNIILHHFQEKYLPWFWNEQQSTIVPL